MLHAKKTMKVAIEGRLQPNKTRISVWVEIDYERIPFGWEL
jgi:hypothetical protein